VAAPGAAGASPIALEALLARGAASARTQALDADDPAIVATRWDLRSDATGGSWHVRIERAQAGDTAGPPAGWLLVAPGGEGDAPARLVSYVTTFRLVEGERIGVVASLEDAGAPTAARLLAASVDAQTLIGPFALPMADDGAHADGAAGDGVFGAWLPDLPPGEVLARVVAQGLAADGEPVLRSVQHVFPVVARAATLTGAVTASELGDGRIALDAGVALQGAPSAPRLQVSGEVWAANVAGETVPVCWLSTMASVDASSGAPALRLALDPRWLALAGAATASELELRALRLQDPGTHVVLDELDIVAVDTKALAGRWSALVPAGAALSAPTRDMLMGPPVGRPGSPPSAAAGGGPVPFKFPTFVRRDPALMLVHGYCSSGVWPQQDFTEPKLTFLDPNQNRTNDEFAQLIKAFGAQKLSFGIVAHSQGGLAALHLYTFYESGLEHAVGDRLIQSVGSPYQGTPLAGNLAVIGQIFGGGCGENNDMTPSGAAAWLSTIPSWARDKVFYWTTSDAGSACNILTNLFLSNPEDGVVEMAKGQLPGGHNMGHKTGWCHTTGMSYPANYTDHVRNAEMNVEAAR
jgi:hypothetical protein